ncbi:MAG TPA: DUF1614 domain-containing protein [Methanoregulaceae archaeon]|nr:DUF1614 domain-containing protein [Methanoregulaceae archaeon]HQJ87807.1 DUF1614 domain-containing protein [Methanoregulaceae archaeon]
MDRSPVSPVLLLLLGAALLLLVPLLFLQLVGGAFARLGFTPLQVFALLALTLAGSFVNIPVARVRARDPFPLRLPPGWRMVERLYRIPPFSPETTVAVNLGGAVIPTVVSIGLTLAAVRLGGPVCLLLVGAGVLAVTIVTRLSARPVPGLGITTPFFIPPLCAGLAGLLLGSLAPGTGPAIGYISGTLGTLIGADLLLWREYPRLGAGMVSIGGAGTFDGIFLAGIIAALIA